MCEKHNNYYILNFPFEMYLFFKFTPRSLGVEFSIFQHS